MSSNSVTSVSGSGYGNRGNLQLLSHGHPSLLLNYCKYVLFEADAYVIQHFHCLCILQYFHNLVYLCLREYWDGCSIAPVEEKDRKEILSVYDRYAEFECCVGVCGV